MGAAAILERVAQFGARYVCVTGGEPLAQQACLALLSALADDGYRVSLETSGAMPIDAVDPRVIRVVDVKTPGSGEEPAIATSSLQLLRPEEQMKFVICDRADYEWSRDKLETLQLASAARCCSRRATSSCRRGSWPTGFSRTGCRCASRSSCTNISGAMRPGTLNAGTRAVVLLSGGLDSATTLALARSQGFECYALSVAYGQRHAAELAAAARVARRWARRSIASCAWIWPASAARHSPIRRIAVPEAPAPRHSRHLRTGAQYHDAGSGAGLGRGARGAASVIGVNALDYSGYPDCRPEFIRSFEALAALATKAGVEGARFSVHAPLIAMSKAEIIRSGLRARVSTTPSPYPATRPTQMAAPAGAAIPVACAARALQPPALPIRRATPEPLALAARCRAARRFRYHARPQRVGSSVGRAAPF